MIALKKPRVIVAMSGGVDSSLAAAMLKQEGYEVIGLMLRLWADEEGAANRCCTPASISDAGQVANFLDIPFYVRDYKKVFKETVVQYFIRSYLNGTTPNPCLVCNREIRFSRLLNEAISLGAEYLATGHYARLRQADDSRWELLKGRDPQKDQSYVLHVLNQAQLSHVLFPLGDMLKTEVRRQAKNSGLPVFARPDSQDLCFIIEGDYRLFLQKNAPAETILPGPILRKDGSEIGRHNGLLNYTIGQRKGLGLYHPEPLYVMDIDTHRNALVVGTLPEMGRDELTAGEAHFISGIEPPGPMPVTAKIRYKAQEKKALLTPLPDCRFHIKFEEDLRDITPGQAVVLYQNEVTLGGGIIEKL
jgi:tRNA-uridine 2-sulfurtransferase